MVPCFLNIFMFQSTLHNRFEDHSCLLFFTQLTLAMKGSTIYPTRLAKLSELANWQSLSSSVELRLALTPTTKTRKTVLKSTTTNLLSLQFIEGINPQPTTNSSCCSLKRTVYTRRLKSCGVPLKNFGKQGTPDVRSL
jgi:hypothetical protein